MSDIPFRIQIEPSLVMYKLALYFCLLLYCKYCNAKLAGKYLLDIDVGHEAKVTPKVCLSDTSKDTLWVLDLNDDELNFKQLRSANKMDRRVYREVMEPAIKNHQYEQLAAALDSDNTTKQEQSPKTNVDTEFITKYDVKKQILCMFNKFIMPYQEEPTLSFHLGDNNKLSIKLYFKGPYTSLVVSYKNKRWNYFLESPSLLPGWFYQKHTNVTRSGQAMYVKVPDNVIKEFYGKFFHLLQLFLSIAL